ncbi:YybH family protein [Brevundimonas sp. NPDC090276]|uniref:YybH family protein n=1 Tax=Brevundimonas sp. NPDC090276 TaxID=3363956 RepID=UPI00383A7B07
MIRARSLAALALTVALATGSSACAQSIGMQGGGDEVIRTARSEAPAASTPPVAVPTTAETFDAVSNTLDAAAEAWSSGDVEAVMATYVNDEPLLVFLGDTPVKGPDAVRAALEARAAQPGGLGQMTYEWFETLQFDVNTTVVSGRVVMRREGKTHRGLFTRVLRRTENGWRIVHDQLAWGPDA